MTSAKELIKTEIEKILDLKLPDGCNLMETASMMLAVNELLLEDYMMLDSLNAPMPSEEEKHYIPALIIAEMSVAASDPDGKKAVLLAAACQCFYMFRKFHYGREWNESLSIILGDYFSSRFSHFLVELDLKELPGKFSEFLQWDCEYAISGGDAFPLAEYVAFCRGICRMGGIR